MNEPTIEQQYAELRVRYRQMRRWLLRDPDAFEILMDNTDRLTGGEEP